MKTILKLIGGLFLGACFGLFLAIPVFALIDGESISTVVKNIIDKISLQDVAGIVWMLVAALIAFILHLVIHEGGHLVAGLLTGYRFVSFRFLNWTLISKEGRLQCRNYELVGTGGQCLLAPPDKPLEQIDTRWYNAGGVLANILTMLLCLLLLWAFDMPSWLNTFFVILAIMSTLSALTNGIPMMMGGVANDGLNLKTLEKDIPGKQCFCSILELNARSQEGEPYDKMPDRIFELPHPIDWKNSMQVGVVLAAVTRMFARHQWEEAYRLLSEALEHKNDYMLLYQLEMENLMTQACIITGRDEEARQHYSDKVDKHVARHASTQSDKQFTMMAVALALENNRPVAEQILHQLEADHDKYIHQSDVALSLDLMHHLLDNRQ